MPVAEQGTIVVDGHVITVTNPNKPLWPEAGVTKLLYMQKLVALSPYLLRYCRERYLTVIRYPHGVGDKSFYQKNAPSPLPPYVNTAISGDIRYVVLDSLPTLLWLANLAALEFHPSCERIGTEQPLEWLIDLDPSRDPEPRIMEAAAIVGDTLRALGIASVPKTSGATGVQIFVPIRTGITFPQLRQLGEFIARYVTELHPDLFTIERLTKDRGTRIYFDYLQHWPGKTISAPYTTRARTAATVSTPLTWDEVKRGASPLDYNLHTIESRLARYGDLIADLPPQPVEDVLAHIAGGP